MSYNTTNPTLDPAASFAGLLATGAGLLAMGAGGAVAHLGVRSHRPSDGDASELLARARVRYMARMRPHSSPMVIAICRAPDGGRRYHQCATRDQAIAHGPYLIEHVNGWGQVTSRERSQGAPGHFA